MEAKTLRRRGELSWRLWALVPVVLLALAVGGYVATGSSIVELIGSNPPQADEFDVRRVEFEPGEIRVRVTNPQQNDLTIASVTVDDAIVRSSCCGLVTRTRISPGLNSTRRTSNASACGGFWPINPTIELPEAT